MKNLIVLVLLALLAFPGCGRDDNPVRSSGPVIENPEETIVMENCLVVRAVVEEFASRNNGIYPNDVDADTTSAGGTVIDLLPGGRPIENPFTGARTEPVNGEAANPGEIGYLPVNHEDWNVGYTISGFGVDSVIVKLSNIGSQEEAVVRANCLVVRRAAEEYAAGHNGIYPRDGSYSWKDIRRQLPDSRPLENPFTGLLTEPVMRTAVNPGETGYTVVIHDGAVIGYVITGFGESSVIVVSTNLEYSRNEAVVVSNCRTVQKAVEEFAVENGTIYPEDVDCDRTPDGKTVLDILPGRLENPFTGLDTEPERDIADDPGEIGYEVLRLSGWNIGYTITGFGEDSRIAELTNLESPMEAVVRVNCLILRQAVEDFTARNGGVYPEDVDRDTTPGGETVVDLLPRRRLHENPFMREYSEPANRTAVIPGETGYAVYRRYGENLGYVITGYGENSIIAVINSLGYPPEEAIVVSNCRTVQFAAERFAALNNGIYPGGLSDTTPSGDTIIDLLPNGSLLENPFTRCRTEPVNCYAGNPGETGYSVVVHHGCNTGYHISGAGRGGKNIVLIWQALHTDQRH